MYLISLIGVRKKVCLVYSWPRGEYLSLKYRSDSSRELFLNTSDMTPVTLLGLVRSALLSLFRPAVTFPVDELENVVQQFTGDRQSIFPTPISNGFPLVTLLDLPTEAEEQRGHLDLLFSYVADSF